MSITSTVKTVSLSTGVTLPYVEQGDPTGVPVVLLHGVTDSWRSFEPVLSLLPPHVHAFALTQRGHGDAERPESGYLMDDFAADVAEFMDAAGLETAVIVGHSMGASVAQQLAIDYPDRLRGMVLMAAFYNYSDNPVVMEFWNEAIESLTDPIDPAIAREFQESTLAKPIPHDQLDTFVAESLKVPARVWRAVFDGTINRYDPIEPNRIKTPTLIIWGDQDGTARKEDQDMLASAIPNSRLVVYSGHGHAVHWEDPERVASDIVSFIERNGK